MKTSIRTKLACMTAVMALAGVWAGAASPATAVFQFKRISNTNSRLTIGQYDTATGKVYSYVTFRAGSGISTDECWTSHGWLPTGLYNIVLHSDSYAGSKVRGRVWQLSDRRCQGGAGTLRTELFIHSEETPSQGQSCGPAGTDYPFCWEGDNDYRSEGCIKVDHFTTMPSLDGYWHAWKGTAGPNRLLVV
jgi:hypothetical protein